MGGMDPAISDATQREARVERRSTRAASATNSPPRHCPARCRSGATRRSAVPTACYAEQLSGSAFTAPRGANRRSWLYRIRPGATHGAFRRSDDRAIVSISATSRRRPARLRWDPLPLPASGESVDSCRACTRWPDRRSGGDERLRDPPVLRERVDARALLLRRRRRTAHRTAIGRSAPAHRTRLWLVGRAAGGSR